MKIRLGSRGSALALAQVELFNSAFASAFPEDQLEVEIVKTTGDRKQGTPEASLSDKREWIHELERGIVQGTLDAALHSGKDVPCEVDSGTELLPVLPRAMPNDIFIGRMQEDGTRIRFEHLPEGARIGTASLRRRAQLLRLKSDTELVELRGNVGTRLRKLDEGQADGIVLAAAGLERLAELEVQGELMKPEQMLPAVNQGMLCLQLKRDHPLKEKSLSLVSEKDRAVFLAERRVAEVLEGDCHSAIGIFACVEDGELSLRSEVYSHDGAECIAASKTGTLSQAQELGEWVGEALLSQGAKKLL